MHFVSSVIIIFVTLLENVNKFEQLLKFFTFSDIRVKNAGHFE